VHRGAALITHSPSILIRRCVPDAALIVFGNDRVSPVPHTTSAPYLRKEAGGNPRKWLTLFVPQSEGYIAPRVWSIESNG